MLDMFKAAIKTMDSTKLLQLREDYAKFVRKMEPQIENDKTGYYECVPAGVQDGVILAGYKERIELIDTRLGGIA